MWNFVGLPEIDVGLQDIVAVASFVIWFRRNLAKIPTWCFFAIWAPGVIHILLRDWLEGSESYIYLEILSLFFWTVVVIVISDFFTGKALTQRFGSWLLQKVKGALGWSKPSKLITVALYDFFRRVLVVETPAGRMEIPLPSGGNYLQKEETIKGILASLDANGGLAELR